MTSTAAAKACYEKAGNFEEFDSVKVESSRMVADTTFFVAAVENVLKLVNVLRTKG